MERRETGQSELFLLWWPNLLTFSWRSQLFISIITKGRWSVIWTGMKHTILTGGLGLGTRVGGHWRPMDTAMAGGTDPTVVPRASWPPPPNPSLHPLIPSWGLGDKTVTALMHSSFVSLSLSVSSGRWLFFCYLKVWEVSLQITKHVHAFLGLHLLSQKKNKMENITIWRRQ